MPFYEYQCSKCNYKLEELQNISDPPLEICPKCKQNTLKRLISTGAGLIFKGSGFYLTDYKNKPSQRKISQKETKNTSSSSENNSTTEKGNSGGETKTN